MKTDTLKSDLILLFVATVWGLAFVAQRVGMDFLGPFAFNGIRFLLGGLSLLPLVLINFKKKPEVSRKGLIWAGFTSGLILFVAATLQQVGIIYTTAGKAGFITGLYVIFVPFLNYFLKLGRTSVGTLIGALLAVTGMALLSLNDDLRIGYGDMLVLFCAVGFALHLIVIGRFSNRYNTANLSFVQCIVCCVCSLVSAFLFETFTLKNIVDAAVPLAYGGIMSVGVAYSLQIYGQKKSPPAHAAVIFSMESVVAAVGGWLLLNEVLPLRGVFGCLIMLAGMLISQLYRTRSYR